MRGFFSALRFGRDDVVQEWEDVAEIVIGLDRGIIYIMATIHISEAEAADDFAGLMARVRAGMDVVIESGTEPVAVIRSAAAPRRSISESIALAEARAERLGYDPTMDSDFAADMEEIIRNRRPRDTSAWD